MDDSPQLEPETPATACPACGAPAFETLCDAAELARQQRRAQRFHAVRLARRGRAQLAERASFTHGYATNLLRCPACATLVRSPRPRARDIEEAYTEERYPADRLDEMTSSQIEAFRPKIAALRALGVTGEVLEIGSFLGGFLEAAREAGWTAIGVDPGKQLAERSRRRGLQVVEATLEEYACRFRDPTHYCVSIWNTFDQLPHPRAGLAAAARLLRPGGILALRVPHGGYYRRLLPRLWQRAGPALYAAEARLAWNNLLGFPYLHGYGVASLDRLVLPAGFERVRVQGDVLCRLSGRSTAGWARHEELLVKRWQRAAIASEARAARSSWEAAPWLDVYYKRAGCAATLPERRAERG